MNEFGSHVPQSRFGFFIQALGPSWLLMLGGFSISLVLIIVLSLRGRGPTLASSSIAATILPLLLGNAKAAGNGIESFGMSALSDMQLKGSDVAGAISYMLAPILIGGSLSVLLAAATMVCSTIRAFRNDVVTDQAAGANK